MSTVGGGCLIFSGGCMIFSGRGSEFFQGEGGLIFLGV